MIAQIVIRPSTDMIKKFLIITSLSTATLFLGGCMLVAYPLLFDDDSEDTDIQYLPSQHARVRLYGQNSFGTALFENTTCDKPSHGNVIQVGTNLSDAFRSMVGKVKNKHIGIPETDYLKNIQQKSMGLSTAFYEEHVILGNQTVVAEILLNHPVSSGGYTPDISRSCRVTVQFSVKAGHDYEIKNNLSSNTCRIAIDDLVPKDDRIIVTPVEIKRCQTQKSNLEQTLNNLQ